MDNQPAPKRVRHLLSPILFRRRTRLTQRGEHAAAQAGTRKGAAAVNHRSDPQ